MSFETEAFNSIYASITIAQCQIRIGRTVIAKALCSGVGTLRENTDEGQLGSIDANVRLLATDEPDGEIKTGTVIEILRSGQDTKTGWVKARVGGRFPVGGLTRLGLEAVNE